MEFSVKNRNKLPAVSSIIGMSPRTLTESERTGKENKMKKTKRILTLILAAVLCLSLVGSLAGCKKNETPADPGSSAEPTDNGGKGGNGGSGNGGSATPAPDTYVYNAKFIPVGGMNNGINPLACRNGRILGTCWEKIGENIPEGATLEYEGQYDVYGMKLYSIGLDGSVQALEGYQPMETDENGSTYTQGMVVTPEGKMVSLETLYRNWYEGPDDVEMYSDEWYQKGYYNYMHYEQNYFLRYLAADGSEEKRVAMSDILTEALGEGWQDNFYPQSFAVDDQGRVYINAGQTILALDADGGFRKTMEFSNWAENVFRLNDGRIGIVYYGDSGEQLTILNTETLELDEEQTYPISNGYNVTVGGGDYDFYYNNGSNFMGYRLADGKAEKVLNWINADVDPSNVDRAFVTEDGQIVSLTSEWDEKTDVSNVSVVLISKVPASSLPHKTAITLATMYLDWNMRRMIVKFNRSNPDYRIEVSDYSEYNTEDDYEAGLTKLNTEIMAGNVPDILNLNGMSTGKLAAKGILADLMPYLSADPELKDQMFDNVLNALLTDGKLYRTASSFNIQTVMGASSVVGDKPGWTLAEFNAALKQMPAGCEPFSQGTTRDSILSWGLMMELNKLVDWSTGVCSFDSPVFTDILKFANQFPKDMDWENMEWEDETERIAAGRQMLMVNYISDFQSYQMYEAVFGGEATFIGFPTSEGTGNMMSFDDSGYAICAKSKNKDAAWQFLRTLMTADYQEQNSNGLPTNRVAFDKMLQDAMTPEYMRDADGNFVLDENGEKIELSKGGWGWGSLTVEIKALTQAQADKIMELVNTTTKVQNYDEELIEMITNESEAFFAGQKSAEEVGRLLQSKMTIYINEQR